ncbi:SDR family oxidoreductase [Paracoccus versutus]|uniref:NAD(P)-dependent dehydrogenase (Short-subunit alcohol dehydrogenase family) n=1 Tax=Paracoccus versutus TaxID=34007 RepID=A0A3D9XSB5_PARVE|nr:SDR family oxidoreductase [Paracoccus versutus]REF73330.1 NAD(P)-dependent dehydrogenase (short-subunit alcohol dehydrogenase family) [Paracoccus versutus]WGR54647.1 SDR family oxidoreductase [Paracoccus versutus]
MGKVVYDFTGEVALVTGAAAGMGLATAKAFAEAGASVVLADVAPDALDRAVESIRANGGVATGVVCDVSDDAAVKALVDRTVEVYGRLDCAFNNAGIISATTPVVDMALSDYDRIMGINLRGVFSALKYEIAQMQKQGQGGAIVNNASLAGKIGVPGRAQYAAAKHGMLGLTKSVALEAGRDNIRVNAICPGTIATPMVERMAAAKDLDTELAGAAVPLNRLGTVEEIAQVVLWLCSEGSSYVLGEPLSVDAGVTIQ